MSPSTSRPVLLRACLALLLALSAAVGAVGAPKVGVILKGRNAFWGAVEKGALRACGELGATIEVDAPEQSEDVAAQIEILRKMAGRGFDAIVIAPASKDALVEPVAKATAAGIKVVIIDTGLAATMTVFVGTDQRQAGRAAGQFLAGFVTADDEVSFFKHTQTRGATTERELGAMESLRNFHPGITIHGDNYASLEPGAEEAHAARLLDTHPATKGIVASGTPGTMAMLRVLKQRGIAGSIHFVGFGFNLNREVAAAIQAGEIDAWVAQLPTDVGYIGTKAAIAMTAGRQPPAVVNTDFLVITKANLNTPEVQALLEL